MHAAPHKQGDILGSNALCDICGASVQEEFDNLQRWFMSPSPQPANSWQAWNAESWHSAGNAAGKQMGRLGACVRAHIFKLPTLVMVLAAVARMKEKGNSQLPKWAVAIILAGAQGGAVSGVSGNMQQNCFCGKCRMACDRSTCAAARASRLSPPAQ
jgi:hypothetical protein